MRRLDGYPGLLLGVVAVAMSVYHVYARLTWYAPDQQALLYITLAFSLVLSFLLFPVRKGRALDRVSWPDLALAALSLACVGYLFVNYQYVVNRFPTAHPLFPADKLVGGLAILLVLEATRRTIGASLPIVAACFLAYGLAGPWLPGVLYHRGLTLEITNLTRIPIKLYAGLLIAQLSFMTLDAPAEVPYGSETLGSHYQGQLAATESRYMR